VDNWTGMFIGLILMGIGLWGFVYYMLHHFTKKGGEKHGV